MAQLFVDGEYNFYEWEDYLQESGQIDLQVPRRRNSTRGREPWLELYKTQIRKYIENDDWRNNKAVSEKDSRDKFKWLFIEDRFVFICLSD